jgi:cellulose synthase/poly-beta-1,6-N-acetylglucosamine synthase-like glycosyltransferase
LDAQRKDREFFPMAWAFIAVEISVAFPTFLHLFWTMFMVRPRRRPQLRLTGEDVPSVDVFITCCREETDLILDTVRGACDVDYPVDRFRVIVLDDGKSDELKTQVAILQGHYTNLYYTAREKFPGVPHHFKAGNLNYGLNTAKEMPGGPSQFIAALDADMIPEKHWLRAIMPHMLIDDRMGLACPPQVINFQLIVRLMSLALIDLLALL